MITFSAQAEQMLDKIANKEEIKKQLIELAEKRILVIGGGDVYKFLVSGQIMNSIGGGE